MTKNIRDTWATPLDFREAVTETFGFPHIDVCADEDNYFGINYFNEEDNGLARDWDGLAWCNPPGSEVAEWARKANGENATSLVLVQQGLESKWFQEVKNNCLTLLLTPRIQFLPPAGIPKSSNPRNYMLLVFEPWMKRIQRERIETWKWK